MDSPHHEQRRYVALVTQLTSDLTLDSYEQATQAARAALLVRGFETIKLANIDRYHDELERLGIRQPTG